MPEKQKEKNAITISVCYEDLQCVLLLTRVVELITVLKYSFLMGPSFIVYFSCSILYYLMNMEGLEACSFPPSILERQKCLTRPLVMSLHPFSTTGII